MSIKDIINFIKGLGVTTPIYPLGFPASSPVEAMMVELGQGASYRGSVADITLTITGRAKHPQRSEKASQEVMDKLHLLTDQTVGDKQIILIKSQQIMPMFVGRDAEDNHYYMTNFKVLIS